jgi:hypothetical protein
MVPRELFLSLGIGVTITISFALLISAGLLALAVDEWLRWRSEPKESLARYSARHEVILSASRFGGVLLDLILGVAWVIVATMLESPILRLTPLTLIIMLSVISHAVRANVEGIMGLLYRRKVMRLPLSVVNGGMSCT